MHFGKRIQAEADSRFDGKYIDYALLKAAIHREVEQRLAGLYEQQNERETSITIANTTDVEKQDDFFDAFDKEVQCCVSAPVMVFELQRSCVVWAKES
jgi:SPX domain protein involved in polyphosphate accumulation